MSVYRLGELVPDIAPDAGYIAPNATIIGNVRLARQASVWFGAVIRGDNEPIDIGVGSNVQDNVVMHTDPGFPLTIGERCTIGHLACLHGCTIGAGSLVGMGAVVLNGARIGENCLIGARALITEGTIVPPGSLVVGAPGKAIRQLTQDQIAGLKRSAQSYVERSARFSAQLSVQTADGQFLPS